MLFHQLKNLNDKNDGKLNKIYIEIKQFFCKENTSERAHMSSKNKLILDFTHLRENYHYYPM